MAQRGASEIQFLKALCYILMSIVGFCKPVKDIAVKIVELDDQASNGIRLLAGGNTNHPEEVEYLFREHIW